MTDSPLRKLIPLQDWTGPIADAPTIAELDRSAIEDLGLPGAVLMERAAEACASRILQRAPRSRRVAVLVGPGNNGGDGSAIARLLHEFSWEPTIILAAEESRLKGDAELNYRMAKQLGIPIVEAEDEESVRETLRGAPIWVDALLGVGNEEAPRGTIGELVELAVGIRALSETDSTHWTLAVDLPTGLGTSSGRCPGAVLRADETVALGAPKPAHYLPAGLRECGATFVGDIGVLSGPSCKGIRASAFSTQDFREDVMRRGAASYKSSSGHVLVLAGSPEMPGAAALCVTAALRAGAGLVSLASDESVRHLVIQREPSVIGVPIETIAALEGDELSDFLAPYTSFLIGPGFGTASERVSVFKKLQAALDGRPCIVDADGLTMLARAGEAVNASGPLTLTPHPGELARLLERDTDSVLQDIPDATAECARRYGAIVCTKAAGAWISDGEDARAVYGGVPMLAAAGSGDVLAGIISAFSHGLHPLEACAHAAFIHITAGRVLARRRAGGYATAIEIADAITPALVVARREDS